VRGFVFCNPTKATWRLLLKAFRDRTKVRCQKEDIVEKNRFDAITRAVGAQSDRRGMVKAAAGGILGLAGLSVMSDGALARRCDRDRDCRGDDVCDRDRNRCVECLKNRDCKGNDVCEKHDNVCVECKNNKQCSNDERCNNKNKCVKR
jgi:hypothetical protein